MIYHKLFVFYSLNDFFALEFFVEKYRLLVMLILTMFVTENSEVQIRPFLLPHAQLTYNFISKVLVAYILCSSKLFCVCKEYKKRWQMQQILEKTCPWGNNYQRLDKKNLDQTHFCNFELKCCIIHLKLIQFVHVQFQLLEIITKQITLW